MVFSAISRICFYIAYMVPIPELEEPSALSDLGTHFLQLTLPEESMQGICVYGTTSME